MRVEKAEDQVTADIVRLGGETLRTVIPFYYQECYMWVFLNQLDQELKVAQQQWRRSGE